MTAETAIAPLPVDGPRPLVSVVLPVYEPDGYLLDALRSVLSQDPGPAVMQIAVVDDASPACDVKALLDQVAPAGRIEFHRAIQNRGLARNWNECINLSRGEIVHILHQDDRVADGFYRRMLPAFSRHADIGMAFCRHAFIDSDSRVTRTSHRERWLPGVLEDWLPKISRQQRIQCAAALVRRGVYERLGGYRTDLSYTLDWEMWVRIAAQYPVWYQPAVLAHYRRHDKSETARLRNDSRIGCDTVQAIETFASHLPEAQRERLLSAAYETFARRTLKRLIASERSHASGNDLDELLEPVRVAIDRVTQSEHAVRELRQTLARLQGE